MKSKKILILTLTFLVVSLAINYYLYTLSRNYYLQLNGLRLDPLGLVYSPKNPPLTETSLPLIVFFGDSRAYMWPSPNIKTFTFYNLGLGSQTTEQITNRYDLQVLPLRPDILVLQAGINDLKTIPLFPERKQRIIQRCKDNLTEIIQKATSNGTTVVLTTIFPLGEIPLERRLVWSEDVTLAIDEVNNYLKTLSGPNVILLDTSQILVEENGLVQKSYSLDFLHINPTGYEALNKELLTTLEAIKP